MLSVVYVCQRHVGEGKWRECEGQLAVCTEGSAPVNPH